MPSIYPQPGGIAGIQHTLSVMRMLVNRSFTHELIRAQAAHAIQHCSPGNRVCQQASLMAWVKRKMRFVRDPEGVEALHDPIAIAIAIQKGQVPYGDCDDFSMYLAALLKAVGLPATFRAVGFNGGSLSHVYVMGAGNTKLDPTRDLWNPGLGELLPETSFLNWRV